MKKQSEWDHLDTSAFIDKELDRLTIEYGDRYGLYDGKAGLCIAYLLLSEVCKLERFKTKAIEIIDNLNNNISNVRILDFGSGLAGIGWAIEWMVQNEFIEADTDEVLEDLDTELYKSIVYGSSPNLSLSNGALGKALYFYKRLNARNSGRIRSRTSKIEESLIILTDEISDGLLNSETGLIRSDIMIKKQDSHHILEIAQALIFLSKIYKERLNTDVVSRTIECIISFIERIRSFNPTVQSQDNYLFLLYAFKYAGMRIGDNQWTMKSAGLIEAVSFKPAPSSFCYDQYTQYIRDKIFNPENEDRKVSTDQVNGTIMSVFNILHMYSKILTVLPSNWDEAWLLS